MNVQATQQQSVEELLETISTLKDVKRQTDIKAVAAKAERSVDELLRKLTATNIQLTAAHVELETFSYSVAHDLRSPIRQIAGFTRILCDEFGNQLPDEARRYLQNIAQGAKQMGNLVDDLLHLTHIGHQTLSPRHVALSQLVEAAIDTLRPDCAHRNIEWRIEDLGELKCDSVMFRQVFVNLLSNALKFTRGREPAVIEVGQLPLSSERVFFVRDNGVGFDMQYAAKLFGAFQRLHPVSEFEGTGMGLATVERILRRHGGRIWAESQINRGATFYFTSNCSP